MVLLSLFLFQASGEITLPFMHRAELISYDYRLRATLPGGVDPRVVIVDLDERSLIAEGHWPWGRDKLSSLVVKLFDHYNIAVIGFDAVFAEYDDRSGLNSLERLAQGPLSSNEEYLQQLEGLRPILDHDHRFADSIRERLVVLGFSASIESQIGKMPPPVLQWEGKLKEMPFVVVNGYNGNLPELQDAAAGAGFFDNQLVDVDGLYRRVPVLYRYEDGIYESLALAVVRALYGSPPLQLEVSEGAVEKGGELLGLEGVSLDGFLSIPVDEQAAALVPYRGRDHSFPYISATDVLRGKADPKILDGAIVLFGSSAPGIMDLRATPVQSVYPGVEVHANLVAGMLDQAGDGRMLHNPYSTVGYEFSALLVLGLLINLLLPRVSASVGVLVTLLALVGAVGSNMYFWTQEQVLLPLASQLMMVVTLFLFQNAYGYFIESRSKQRLGHLFGQYIPREIVEEMSGMDEDYGIGGESREMTVLFSDVRNFTSISEGLSPDELTHMMNAYLTRVTAIIHHEHGTIDKYIGDAVMAFWGAPLRDPEHPRNAVHAALEMSRQMRQIREEFRQQGWPELRIGVGINTGVMNVGNMGSEFRMAYTVLGDAVNLGARLEGLTKQYGVEILVSEFTRAGMDDIAFREIGLVKVKGKDQAVAIFEPVGLVSELSDEEQQTLDLYHEALQEFRQQQWEPAEERFQQLSRSEPDRLLYRLYLEQIGQYRQSPPSTDWDAVITFDTK
jgi:adenylate cyclase